MKAVACLVYTYFAGSRVSRWLTVSGLLLLLVSLYVVLYLPQTEHMLAVAVPGLMLFFLGTSLMPLTLGRLAGSHAACLLPGARAKLLASAILTVLLVALPAGLITPLAYVAGMSAEVSKLFEDPRLLAYTLWLALYTYTSACIAASWLYVFMWFIGNERNLTGVAKAMVIFLVLLFLPTTHDRGSDPQLQLNLWQLAVFALVFSAGFLGWPRIKRLFAGRGRLRRAASRNVAGKEVDLLLGYAHPWPLIAALLVPAATAARSGNMDPTVWLFYLTIASTLCGAYAGQAPSRSRALWLRGSWTRSSLFATIEGSAWRHNGFVLVVLVAMLLAIGGYAKMPMAAMAVGIPLLIIGTVLSTYLGLMLTRGVRWPEATLGIAVMLSLMAIALATGKQALDSWLLAGLLLVMAGIAIVLRQVALSRWARIDWSQCRSETQALVRAG
jgi:hypothetical protein